MIPMSSPFTPARRPSATAPSQLGPSTSEPTGRKNQIQSRAWAATSRLGIVGRMNPTNYEAPQIERLGTVAELTEGGGLTNSDNGHAQ